MFTPDARLRICSALLPLVIGWTVVGCGGQQEAEIARKSKEEVKPTVIVPKQPEHYEGNPYWEQQSRSWPALQKWALGAGGERLQDSLFIRMTGSVIQSFLSGPKGKKHPLMCSIQLTVRPIPLRLVGRAFTVDSVIYYDPVKRRSLPMLKMLSFERHTEKGTVRTEFTNDVGLSPSPDDLVENQQLEPRVYVTLVEGKTAEIELAPMKLTFLREIRPEGIPTDSLKWGPT